MRITAGTAITSRRAAARRTYRLDERPRTPGSTPSGGSRPMSDSRAIDRESGRRIREELLENILVEAGAGSGKTQMLAERMAAGVASGVYEVEHMAAVTFTRKAASELRGRFHLALEAELSKARDAEREATEQNGERIARIQTALSNLE